MQKIVFLHTHERCTIFHVTPQAVHGQKLNGEQHRPHLASDLPDPLPQVLWLCHEMWYLKQLYNYNMRHKAADQRSWHIYMQLSCIMNGPPQMMAWAAIYSSGLNTVRISTPLVLSFVTCSITRPTHRMTSLYPWCYCWYEWCYRASGTTVWYEGWLLVSLVWFQWLREYHPSIVC